MDSAVSAEGVPSGIPEAFACDVVAVNASAAANSFMKSVGLMLFVF